MRCICCNKNLSDYESTRKSVKTGVYLDLCRKCNREALEDKAEAYEDTDIDIEDNEEIPDDES